MMPSRNSGNKARGNLLPPRYLTVSMSHRIEGNERQWNAYTVQEHDSECGGRKTVVPKQASGYMGLVPGESPRGLHNRIESD
ncbi:Piso0_005195 [Millerozyma farinosa CBS 7064]|uniref:Piso0_005195 protein n=1 Tax=Pichia sorbitophila (strain ATCC MYA-4447 / BCRC 22081 / CBS 7064 / NBRC 10061 / NRRL Y-12695) TaxID=559304 RepID=G8Y4G6_PICSO|nr:Piso0_005195 [Millerozyma farinosa CBS 7064]